jgi:hypothetical protein
MRSVAMRAMEEAARNLRIATLSLARVLQHPEDRNLETLLKLARDSFSRMIPIKAEGGTVRVPCWKLIRMNARAFRRAFARGSFTPSKERSKNIAALDLCILAIESYTTVLDPAQLKRFKSLKATEGESLEKTLRSSVEGGFSYRDEYIPKTLRKLKARILSVPKRVDKTPWNPQKFVSEMEAEMDLVEESDLVLPDEVLENPQATQNSIPEDDTNSVNSQRGHIAKLDRALAAWRLAYKKDNKLRMGPWCSGDGKKYGASAGELRSHSNNDRAKRSRKKSRKPKTSKRNPA